MGSLTRQNKRTRGSETSRRPDAYTGLVQTTVKWYEPATRIPLPHSRSRLHASWLHLTPANDDNGYYAAKKSRFDRSSLIPKRHRSCRKAPASCRCCCCRSASNTGTLTMQCNSASACDWPDWSGRQSGVHRGPAGGGAAARRPACAFVPSVLAPRARRVARA